MNKHDRPRTMLLFPCASVWKRQSDWPNSYVKYYAGYVPGASGVKVGNGTGATSTLPMVMIADSSPPRPQNSRHFLRNFFHQPRFKHMYRARLDGQPPGRWGRKCQVSGARFAALRAAASFPDT